MVDWRGATTDPGPWLPDGSGILVMSDLERDITGLGVLDAVTGHLSWLDTPDWDVEEVALPGAGGVLVWMVNVDGASQLRARHLVTGEDLQIPALPVGSASELRVIREGSAR